MHEIKSEALWDTKNVFGNKTTKNDKLAESSLKSTSLELYFTHKAFDKVDLLMIVLRIASEE